MQHVLIVLVAVVLAAAAQEPSPDPDFLDTNRIVEAKPAKGELMFRDLEGDLRTLREGDYLEEVDGARVKKISRTTLVLTRVMRGGDGQEGEALRIVNFKLARAAIIRLRLNCSASVGGVEVTSRRWRAVEDGASD